MYSEGIPRDLQSYSDGITGYSEITPKVLRGYSNDSPNLLRHSGTPGKLLYPYSLDKNT